MASIADQRAGDVWLALFVRLLHTLACDGPMGEAGQPGQRIGSGR